MNPKVHVNADYATVGLDPLKAAASFIQRVELADATTLNARQL